MSRIDWRHRLQTGEGIRDGWAGVMQLANGFVSAGLPETAVRSMLLEPTNEGARFLNFDSKGNPRPAAERERQARNAVRSASRHQINGTPFRDRAETVEQLATLQGLADADPARWKGAGGATERAVLQACIEIALDVGCSEFWASIRQLADRANVSVGAAKRARSRLRRDWLEVIVEGAGTRAAVLRLRTNLNAVPKWNPLSLWKEEPMGSTWCASHDLWRGNPGLGKATGRVYALLQPAPQPAGEIATALGVETRVATKHLRKLERYELAERWQDGWALGSADVDDVATDLGVAGRRADQHARHRVHAEQRAEYLQQRAHQVERKHQVERWWETWWASLQEQEVPRAA